tara:strand:- start:485 stop:1669 length:1185 start_codon:yes stop_codon:yes gene_type:complete
MNSSTKPIPLISIVVPTKDRNVYLFKLIEYFLKSIVSDQIEFIIQDNTKDNFEILKFLENNNDPRIKYFHNSIWLSISENCDIGISNSSGEFVTLIGDDDGFLPWIVDVCNWMKNKNIDVVLSNKPHYIWSDVSDGIWGNKFSGKLTYSDYTNKIKYINLDKEQNIALKKAATSLNNLPRVYQSIVSRDILNNLKKVSGSFFPGPSPDMANAIGLLSFIHKAVYIDFPIVITGNGYKSTGGEGIRGKHHGKIEDKTFLPKNTAENWEIKNPFFWCGSTIYAESAIKAFIKSGRKDLVENFNYNYLYAHCLVFERFYLKETFKKIKKEIKNQPLSLFVILFYFFKIFFIRAITFIKNVLSNKLNLTSLKIKNFETINLASEFLIKKFENKSKPWE